MAPGSLVSARAAKLPLTSMMMMMMMVMAASSPLAAGQLNTERWPDASEYQDVTEKYIPIRPSDGCDDVIGRFSFTKPRQLFQSPFEPFNATKGDRQYSCRGPPWQGVGLEVTFQTRDFVPVNGMVGVWIGGVEIMRGLFPAVRSTSRPGAGTKRWTIEKSVTQFYSLMRKKQTVKVSVAYDDRLLLRSPPPVLNATLTLRYYTIDANNGDEAATFPPIVRPVSQGAANVAPWFTLATGTNGSATLTLPRNMLSANIEVIGSIVPNAPFNRDTNEGRDKQVQVLMDDVTAGFAYVGFVGNNRLREPLPLSYSVDITPLVGHLVDGKPHTFVLKNPHQQLLLVGANLFVYVDTSVTHTSGTLLESSSNGPFQLVTGYRDDADGTCPFDESPEYVCDRKVANSNVTLRGTITSSAGMVYVNVTQSASLVWEGERGICSGLRVDLRVVQQTSRGNTPTTATSVGRTESVFNINDRSCQDFRCTRYDELDSSYSVRRTRQGVLLRKQYHRTRLLHDDVSRGSYPDYDGSPCDYSEDSSSEFVYADYEGVRCFTFNTTNEYDTQKGTTTTSVDTVECPPRS